VFLQKTAAATGDDGVQGFRLRLQDGRGRCVFCGKNGMTESISKTLILHIGANKTGSSAIQEFLRLNAQALADRGVIVAPADLMPGGTVSGQHVPFLEHLRENMQTGREVVRERIFLLMRDAPAGGKVIVSAENLSNLNGTRDLFADTLAQHNAKVVLYLRRQDELLLSSWQQWGSKESGDFWAWIVSQAGRRGNWRLTLEPWEELVPRNQITVRIYDRARLHEQNVIADFLYTLGLADDIGTFEMPANIINPSYSAAVLDFVKGNPLLFRDIHDNAIYEMIGNLTGDRFHRNPRESIITHDQRLALLQKYSAVNAWVKNRYFPDSKEPLFPVPQARDYDVIDREKLVEQKWQLAASLIYGLSQRILS
jgi:hypothetical protein